MELHRSLSCLDQTVQHNNGHDQHRPTDDRATQHVAYRDEPYQPAHTTAHVNDERGRSNGPKASAKQRQLVSSVEPTSAEYENVSGCPLPGPYSILYSKITSTRWLPDTRSRRNNVRMPSADASQGPSTTFTEKLSEQPRASVK